MKQPYKDREISLLIMRLFLLIVFGGGAWAGIRVLFDKPTATNGITLGWKCFAVPMLLFGLFVFAILARAILGAPREWRKHKRLVQTKRLDESRPATIFEAYSRAGTRYAYNDQLLIVDLTNGRGQFNQSDNILSDFETRQQIDYLLKYKARYEKYFNVRVNFTKQDVDRFHKYLRSKE